MTVVQLAPSSSDRKTAPKELERVVRKWGMAVNYPKTEAVVFGLPPLPRSKLDPTGWQSGLSSSVDSNVQADGGQDTELQRRLCSAAQVFRSLKATPFSSKGVGLGPMLTAH